MLVNSITEMYSQEHLYSSSYLIHLSPVIEYEDNEHNIKFHLKSIISYMFYDHSVTRLDG